MNCCHCNHYLLAFAIYLLFWRVQENHSTQRFDATKDNFDVYGFLRSSSIHLNKLEACAVNKNMEVMNPSSVECWTVVVALELLYTHFGVFLQLTKLL